jgi:hypothetical protein
MTGGTRDPCTVTFNFSLVSMRPANDNHVPRDTTSAVADTAPIMLGPGGCSDRYMLVYPLLCPANDRAPLSVA